MRYFLDTEFAEKRGSIDLISIGIVSEDGREFYAEVDRFDDSVCNQWVRENILPKLWSRQKDKSPFNAWSRDGGCGGLMTVAEIASGVQQFVGSHEKPQFWGYYCDYDWVVFCWLFGSMIELPKGWPMYCRDLKQWCDQLGNPILPPQVSMEHNALEDARWNRKAWNFLEELQLVRANQ